MSSKYHWFQLYRSQIVWIWSISHMTPLSLFVCSFLWFFCLSMFPVSASSGLWSNLPSKTIKSEKSVLHLILHSFSMHLQSLIVFVSFSLLNLFVFTQKRLQTIIWMNDNIHMDSTIARSTIYPFTLSSKRYKIHGSNILWREFLL